YIAGIPGSEVVFDYSEPAENRDAAGQATLAFNAARVAVVGEPWISFFDPVALRKSLNDLGFGDIEDLESGDIAARFASAPSTGRSSGGHILRARRSV
ncbi:SAM-dependent methyltransferase, partial [Mesorhizobium sp. M2E.F.Ca.ET.154.01.1.1]